MRTMQYAIYINSNISSNRKSNGNSSNKYVMPTFSTIVTVIESVAAIIAEPTATVIALARQLD